MSRGKGSFPIPFAETLSSSLLAGQALPSPLAVERLERYAALILEWNCRFNLTAIREPAELVRRHIAEPLAAANLLPGGRLVDIGAGVGVPGLPLHIVRGEGELVLVEASEKRCAFLRAVVEALPVEGATVLARQVQRPGDLSGVAPAEAVTFRAIPEPEKKLKWLPRLLHPNGMALLFLGKSAADGMIGRAADHGLVLVDRRLLPGARSSWVVALRRRAL